jgi:hypothetical protein
MLGSHFCFRYELYDAVGLDPSKIKKYCDNVGNDTRRVVTVRTSIDGKNWTQDWGLRRRAPGRRALQDLQHLGARRPMRLPRRPARPGVL